MDYRIQFGNDGFTFQAALIHHGVSSVINTNSKNNLTALARLIIGYLHYMVEISS